MWCCDWKVQMKTRRIGQLHCWNRVSSVWNLSWKSPKYIFLCCDDCFCCSRLFFCERLKCSGAANQLPNTLVTVQCKSSLTVGKVAAALPKRNRPVFENFVLTIQVTLKHEKKKKKLPNSSPVKVKVLGPDGSARKTSFSHFQRSWQH